MPDARIALATYAAAPDLAPDDRLLRAALENLHVRAEPAVWSSPDADWSAFDAVVIRSCWDYHRAFDAFTAWLARLDSHAIPVWNRIPLLRWNADKRYLLDLARRGVPTIPTIVIPRGDGRRVGSIASAEGWSKIVVKPAVSASGYETHALAAPFDDAIDTIARVASKCDVLVQPFAPEVSRDGELSLVFLDGGFSHSARKRAAPGEFRVQVEHGGTVEPAVVSSDVIEQARRAIAALDEVPVYARVDGILRDGALLLMELELIEPNLFLGLEESAAERLATIVVERLA